MFVDEKVIPLIDKINKSEKPFKCKDEFNELYKDAGIRLLYLRTIIDDDKSLSIYYAFTVTEKDFHYFINIYKKIIENTLYSNNILTLFTRSTAISCKDTDEVYPLVSAQIIYKIKSHDLNHADFLGELFINSFTKILKERD